MPLSAALNDPKIALNGTPVYLASVRQFFCKIDLELHISEPEIGF